MGSPILSWFFYRHRFRKFPKTLLLTNVAFIRLANILKNTYYSPIETTQSYNSKILQIDCLCVTRSLLTRIGIKLCRYVWHNSEISYFLDLHRFLDSR